MPEILEIRLDGAQGRFRSIGMRVVEVRAGSARVVEAGTNSSSARVPAVRRRARTCTGVWARAGGLPAAAGDGVAIGRIGSGSVADGMGLGMMRKSDRRHGAKNRHIGIPVGN